LSVGLSLIHTHTHNHFTTLLDYVQDYPGEPAPKGKTNLDLMEQEIVSGTGISWAICKSAPWPRHNDASIPPPNQQHESTEGNSTYYKSRFV